MTTRAVGARSRSAFGVRASGINKFTFGLFSVFVLSALLIHWTSDKDPNAGSVLGDQAGAQSAFDPNAPGTSPDNPIPISSEDLQNLPVGGGGGK